jgi:hypothetical protein
MSQPIRLVVERGGKSAGTTRLLDDREVPAYAKWLGLVGGRELLDAFEVKLINDGMLRLWPVDAEGEPLHGECEALEIRRYDDGPRIVWEAKIQCDICCGQGHHNLHGEPVEEDDLCITCDGSGYTTGPEFETDINGEPLRVAPTEDAA